MRHPFRALGLCVAGALVLSACVSGEVAAAPVAAPIVDLAAVPDYVAPPVAQLEARTVRIYDAPEADQGVAVDADFFYALDNTIIGKYRRDTGALVARFTAPHKGLIRHMNSCYAREAKLWCANSNYSLVPMGSSIEVFDAASMTHVATHSLGMMDEGSLTWFDDIDGGRIAAFAHYSGNGGVPFKDSTYSSVVTFDTDWRRTGGWLFPERVIQRMAPHAASGGAIGPDGLLYVLGHDLPEMYVLARPSMGPTMIHVATIKLGVGGQAFSFAPGEGRVIFAIDRAGGKVSEIVLPEVTLNTPDAQPFTHQVP